MLWGVIQPSTGIIISPNGESRSRRSDGSRQQATLISALVCVLRICERDRIFGLRNEINEKFVGHLS